MTNWHYPPLSPPRGGDWEATSWRITAEPPVGQQVFIVRKTPRFEGERGARSTASELHHIIRLGRATDLAEATTALADLKDVAVPPMCEAHGRPVWHRRATGVGAFCPAPSGRDASVALDPMQVAEDLRVFPALEDLWRSANQRHRHRHVADGTTVETFFDGAVHRDTRPRRHPDQPEFLPPAQSRELVAKGLEALFAACGVSVGFTWPSRQRLAPTLRVHDRWSVLVAELAQQLSSAPETLKVYACGVCERPITPMRAPKPDEPVYCQRPECQRERRRRNTQRSRDRARLALDVQWGAGEGDG